MFTKWMRIILVTAALTLGLTGVAYAEGDAPDNQIRIAGVILNVGFPGQTFAVRTLSGSDVHVHVTGNTQYRSRDGSVQGFDDLVVDMRTVVVGQERGDGAINASVVFAATPEELPEIMRLKGKIDGVGDRFFTLITLSNHQRHRPHPFPQSGWGSDRAERSGARYGRPRYSSGHRR